MQYLAEGAYVDGNTLQARGPDSFCDCIECRVREQWRKVICRVVLSFVLRGVIARMDAVLKVVCRHAANTRVLRQLPPAAEFHWFQESVPRVGSKNGFQKSVLSFQVSIISYHLLLFHFISKLYLALNPDSHAPNHVR